MIQRQALYFHAPCQVIVQEEIPPPLEAGQVLVKTLLSAISPGSEMLIYRGQFPEDLAVDENLPALAGKFNYPLKYGYSAIGRIAALGPQANPALQDRLVFSFHPHESRFAAFPDELLPLPEDISPEDALFLPNMETAVNLVMDGRPLLGERVVVLGQGIVGLLTTALLARFPLESLVTLDHHPLRRQASLELGAHTSLDPTQADSLDARADLSFELSGAPAALDQAIALTGFEGRIVIGSWYGQKRARLDLGGRFHRSRIRLVSSQVSTIASELGGRWDKARRFATTWQMLRLVQPRRFITQRFDLRQAAQAYQLIDQHPEETIQVVFTYPGE